MWKTGLHSHHLTQTPSQAQKELAGCNSSYFLLLPDHGHLAWLTKKSWHVPLCSQAWTPNTREGAETSRALMFKLLGVLVYFEMQTGAQSPEAAPGKGSAAPLELAGPARGADRARHFPKEMGLFPGKMAAVWQPQRQRPTPRLLPGGNIHPAASGPAARRGRAGGLRAPGTALGSAAALPHRCGGETPPWPRSWRPRFRQRRQQRVLRGSASAGRAGPGRAGPGGALAAEPDPPAPPGPERPCPAGKGGMERSPAQQGQGHVGASPEAATKLIRGTEERLRELELVSPEKALGWPSCGLTVPEGSLKEKWGKTIYLKSV